MPQRKPFTTLVFGAWLAWGPSPASSRISSGPSMYVSISRSLFHRRWRNKMAVASDGWPNIADTSSICLSWLDWISAGPKTIWSTSWGCRKDFEIPLSFENSSSGSPSSKSRVGVMSQPSWALPNFPGKVHDTYHHRDCHHRSVVFHQNLPLG